MERVVVTENGKVNLDFEASTNEELSFRCFLPPNILQGLPESKMYIEGGGLIGAGSGEGQAIDITNQEGNTSTLSTLSGGTSSGGDNRGSQSTNNPTVATKSFLEDVVYGQLIENGRPVGGERVEVTWLDGKNESHVDEVITLTTEDARKIGMPQLEGYYFLYTPPSLGFNKIINVQRLGPEVEEKKAIDWSNITNKPKTALTKEAPFIHKEESNFEKVSSSTRSYVAAHPLQLAAGGIILLTIIGILLLIIIAKKRVHQIFLRAIIRQQQNKMTKKIRKLLETKVKKVMKTENTVVAPTTNLHTTLGNILHEDRRYCLVAREGVYQGVITEKDILLHKKTLDGTPVEEVMHNAQQLEPNHVIGELLTLLTKEEVVPIVKNGRLLGAIDRRQILELFDSFFSMHIVEARGMPRVRELKEEGITATEDESISSVLERLEETSLVMIAKTKREAGIYVKQLEGIITPRVLLDEIYNYSSTLEKMTVGRLKVKSTRGVTEGTTLLEAAKLLLEQKMGAYPVLENEKIIGMVSERGIIAALNKYLQRALGDQKS